MLGRHERASQCSRQLSLKPALGAMLSFFEHRLALLSSAID
jgi:hypothetical protein